MKKNSKKDNLKIFLPSGSIGDPTLIIFEEAGYKIKREDRKNIGEIKSIPGEVIFMRPQHIPRAIENEKFAIGICGKDWVAENDSLTKIKILSELSYSKVTNGKVKIAILASKDNTFQSAKDIKAGSRIITEYPNLTRKYFEDLKIPVEIDFSHGNVEAMIPKYYDYGVTVVETGKSLEANNLKIAQVIMESSTVLIASKNSFSTKKKRDQIQEIKLNLCGTLEGRENVMVLFNVSKKYKNKTISLVPSLKSPTISPIFGGGYAVNSVVQKRSVNEIIFSLLKNGATDIVICPISKIITSWEE
jgi:ATP phosphoribosyltransferase